jgi:hypothetical protein
MPFASLVGEMYIVLREQKITQMRRIYESADRVLVLDNGVEELSVSSSICEKAVRISLKLAASAVDLARMNDGPNALHSVSRRAADNR